EPNGARNKELAYHDLTPNGPANIINTPIVLRRIAQISSAWARTRQPEMDLEHALPRPKRDDRIREKGFQPWRCQSHFLSFGLSQAALPGRSLYRAFTICRRLQSAIIASTMARIPHATPSSPHCQVCWRQPYR